MILKTKQDGLARMLTKMKQILYFLIIFVLLGLSSCGKEDISTLPQEINSNLKEITNINEALSHDDDCDISIEYDAIVFFTGQALASTFRNPDFRDVVADFNDNSTAKTIANLCKNNLEFGKQLNHEISNILRRTDAYLEWKESTISQDVLGDFNFDYVTFFENIISKYKRGERLNLYFPEGLEAKDNQANLYVGLDIPTSNADEALVTDGQSNFLLSEQESQTIESQVIFIGINKDVAHEKYDNWIEYKLKKWYHYGRCTLNSSNDQIEVWWITKYRWYSRWKLKEIVTLNSNGESDDYYYWGYRITCHVEFTTSQGPCFLIEQKHWSNNPWQDALNSCP